MTNRGGVRKVIFAPEGGGHNILVLFREGGVGVWDLDQAICLSTQQDASYAAVAIEWHSKAVPIVACSDGHLRFFDLSLAFCSSSFLSRNFREPLASVALLSGKMAAHAAVKAQLQRGGAADEAAAAAGTSGASPEARAGVNYGEALNRAAAEPEAAEEAYRRLLPLRTPGAAGEGSLSLGERCLRTARALGETDEFNFWRLAGTMVSTASSQHAPGGVQRDPPPDIPEFMELFQPPEVLAASEERRTGLRARASRGEGRTRRVIVNHHILLGEHTKAMRCLLAADVTTDAGRADVFKACLVAQAVGPDTFRSTVQMAAMQLMAEDNLDEAVELLTLVPGGIESAASKLQDQGRWVDAARLARTRLPWDAMAGAYRRWSGHLEETGRSMESALVLLSLGEWAEVSRRLQRSGFTEVAAHFQALCEGAGIDLIQTPPGGGLPVAGEASGSSEGGHAAGGSPEVSLTSPRSVLGALQGEVGRDLRRRSITGGAGAGEEGLETHLRLLRQGGGVAPDFLSSPRGVASTPAGGAWGIVEAPPERTVWIEAPSPGQRAPTADPFPFSGIPGSQAGGNEQRNSSSYTGFNIRSAFKDAFS